MAASMSLYRHDGDKISFVRDLVTGIRDNFCHGARFHGPDVAVATTHREPRGAHFFDVHTMEKLLHVETEHLAKDICFLPNGRAIVVTTAGAATMEPGARYVSGLVLVELDLKRRRYEVVKKQTYPFGQFDTAVVHEDHLFVVDSGRGCVLAIDVDTLKQVGHIDGYNFPHGIDINYGMMAIASYGTNSIDITSFDGFG
jgi:hypothetical protein